jgi:WD40 repeat protein
MNMKHLYRLILLFFVLAPQLLHASEGGSIPDLVPIALFNEPIQQISPDGHYAITGDLKGAGAVYNGTVWDVETGKPIGDLKGTLYLTRFVDADHLLHISNLNTQAPRLYHLPDMQEVGRFPVNLQPLPAEHGPGYFYVLNQKSLYWLSSDLSAKPVLLSNQLFNPYNIYAESPDGHTVVVGTEHGIILFDLQKGEKVGQLDYPLANQLHFSADGKRLSAVTNQGKNWLAYDLAAQKPLAELYAPGMANGTISESGRYGAAIQLVTTSGQGVLHIYDFNAADKPEIARIDKAGFNTLFFVNDILVYLSNYSRTGKLTFYNPATQTAQETEWKVYGVGPLPGGLVSAYTSYEPVQVSVIDPATGKLVREFKKAVNFFAGNRYAASGNVLYGMPTSAHPALPMLTGTVNGKNKLNVRVHPTQTSLRINGADGKVTALARTEDSKWIYLEGQGGWVPTNLVQLDGDVQTLTISSEPERTAHYLTRIA